MSLQPLLDWTIPEETYRIAHAAFPKGNTYIKMRDELGQIFEDEEFSDLFSKRGQPAMSPARLALTTVMQYAEGLSDRAAADAVRSRIDWKYLLGLELEHAGFHASVLSEFRTRLIEGQAEMRLFERFLSCLKKKNLIKKRGRLRTDSTHILATVRTLNRLECVGETVRHALNQIATIAPEWLQSWAPTEWFVRYGRRFEDYRFGVSLKK